MNRQQLIDRTRQHLMTGKQDRMNALGDAITAGATSLTLAYGGIGINEGSVLSIDTENFLVMATSGAGAGSTITVMPGWEGSTPADHADGAPVRVNPQFSNWDIQVALDEALLEMSGQGCFYVKDIDIDYNPSTQGYAFTAADFIQPYRIRYRTPGSSKFWPVLRTTDYYIDLHSDTTDFPGGKSVILRNGGHPGQPVKMSYKARFGDLMALDLVTDDVTETGLHPEGELVLSLCAGVRLMNGREIKRNFTTAQTEPRRSGEVPPGAVKGSQEAIQRAYYEQLSTYKLFLHRLYPGQI